MTTLTPSYHAVNTFFFLLDVRTRTEILIRNRTVQTTTVSYTPYCFLLTVSDPLSGFDLRPFLYPSRFPWQFKKIDEVAGALPDRSHAASQIDKAKTE